MGTSADDDRIVRKWSRVRDSFIGKIERLNGKLLKAETKFKETTQADTRAIQTLEAADRDISRAHTEKAKTAAQQRRRDAVAAQKRQFAQVTKHSDKVRKLRDRRDRLTDAAGVVNKKLDEALRRREA